MNTNSTITINTGKTTIKIIPDSDNGKAAILQQSSGKTTNFTIINCKDGELGKHITSFLTKNNIVNQNVIKIISNALLHNNKLSIYTNSNHSINATYFCKNGDVYDDYDNEDEFNENCESDITGLYTSDISGDFHGDIVGTMSGDINGDLNGDIVGTMSGDINGDLNGDIVGTMSGDISGDFNGDIIGIMHGIIKGNTNEAIICDEDDEDNFAINNKNNRTDIYTSDISGDFYGDITGTMKCDIKGNLYGDITGVMEGNIEGDLNGDILNTMNGDIGGNLNGDIFGIMNGNISGDINGDILGTMRGIIKGKINRSDANN